MTRRIPNWLTFPVAVAGVAWGGYRAGWKGALLSLGGLALGMTMILFGMGAGDVKMMAAAGSVAGPQGLLIIFIYSALLGGVVALGLAVARGRLGPTLGNTARLSGLLLRGRFREARSSPASGIYLPYGAVIAAGCLLFVVGPRSL